MSDDNKQNLHYFEAGSMRDLFDALQAWQEEEQKRLLSLSIERDAGKFCCIALTNPTEVIIAGGSDRDTVMVRNGRLRVDPFVL
jgi:hypothetical protein